jgi:hypothetical protein
MTARSLFCFLAMAWFAVIGESEAAGPFERLAQRQFAHNVPWHASYYDPAWNGPVPVVLPPTVAQQPKWNWAVPHPAPQPVYYQLDRRSLKAFQGR